MIPNLSKDMIDIMQILRKALNSEFKLELKLSHSDIIQKIQLWVSKSQNQVNQSLCADLEKMLGIEALDTKEAKIEAPMVKSRNTTRIYRGRIVEQLEEANPVVAQQQTKSKRMYRGQVVN
ncbi:MAG: hypothetical protein V7785_12110 [Bermanella sp.]